MDPALEAVQLALNINNPQYTQQVAQISQRLTNIQLSHDGWRAGSELLRHADAATKFYGALTMQVKLNRDSASLKVDESLYILQQILTAMTEIVVNAYAGSNLVYQKLCSALATFIFRKPVAWPSAVHHVICCFIKGAYVDPDECQFMPDTEKLVNDLTSTMEIGLMQLCKVLIEDVMGFEGQDIAHDEDVAEVVFSTTQDVVLLLGPYFSSIDKINGPRGEQAISCFKDWFFYTFAHMEIAERHEVVADELMSLLLSVIDCFPAMDEDVQTLAAETLTEVVINYSNLISDEAHVTLKTTLLAAGWQSAEAQDLEGPTPSTGPIAGLVVTLASDSVKSMVSDTPDELDRQLLELLERSIRLNGYAGVEDEIVTHATEFWNNLCDALDGYQNDRTPAKTSALEFYAPMLRTVADSFLKKMRYPSEAVFRAWEDDNRARWKSHREDVLDILKMLAGFPEVGLLDNLFQGIQNGASQQQWDDLEVGLTVLASIMEDNPLAAPTDESAKVEVLKTLLDRLLDRSLTLPMATKLSSLRFIERCAPWLQREGLFLDEVILFLQWSITQSPPEQSKLGDGAARALERFCSACRKSLSPGLPDMFSMFSEFLHNPHEHSYRREKVMSALACVIEGLPKPELQVTPLTDLICLVRAELESAAQCLRNNQAELGEMLASGALTCLANVGKGMGDPGTAPAMVDLTKDDGGPEEEQPGDPYFWTHGPGQHVQLLIVEIINVVAYLPLQGDAIDGACAVLHSGLTESRPGPFVLPPSFTAGFISSAEASSPRVEAMLTLACAFVSAQSRHHVPRCPQEVSLVFQTVARIMFVLQEPKQDPQVAQLCLDVLERLPTRYADVLLSLPESDSRIILNLAFRCLDGDGGPMLKRVAANYLVAFMDLAGPKERTGDAQIRDIARALVVVSAKEIAQALMSQVGGNAQRSELDSISKALRSFLHSWPGAKPIIELSMREDAFPSRLVNERQKRHFVLSLGKVAFMQDSNNKKVEDVVRMFWAECKGTVGSFDRRSRGGR